MQIVVSTLSKVCLNIEFHRHMETLSMHVERYTKICRILDTQTWVQTLRRFVVGENMQKI